MVRGTAHFVYAKSVVILLMKMIICRNVNNVRKNVSEDKKNILASVCTLLSFLFYVANSYPLRKLQF